MDDFPEHRGIKIKGQRLACLVAGEPSAPPILMVHGWAHYPDVWTSTMAALRADYYCVAVGLLGGRGARRRGHRIGLGGGLRARRQQQDEEDGDTFGHRGRGDAFVRDATLPRRIPNRVMIP